MASVMKLVILLSMSVLMSAPLYAADGKTLYQTKFCSTCHGVKGKALVPNYPSLVGQNAKYMSAQVKDILSGVRKTNMTILMSNNPVIKNLTEKELTAITEYIANPN